MWWPFKKQKLPFFYTWYCKFPGCPHTVQVSSTEEFEYEIRLHLYTKHA